MASYLVTRSPAQVDEIRSKGDHTDSRSAAWFAIGRGSELIRDIQRVAQTRPDWKSIEDARPFLNDEAKAILDMRLESIHRFKVAPHHARGFRLSARTGTAHPRPVNALCLISGHEGQEIPGLVDHERVVVDAEHMESALGPATLTEIFKIRKHIGEYVYISTNVSETPQIVRDLQTGEVDVRATAALTASKVVAALNAGADVVKVGFANLDPYKRDLSSKSVLEQMKAVRSMVDDVVNEGIVVFPLNRTDGHYPLISVFFPELGIDHHGESPREIAEHGLAITHEAGWQGLLLDTFQKTAGKRYHDFYTLKDTRELARQAHDQGMEFWIAGSIRREEVAPLIECEVDLICFGGAARHASGVRVVDDKSGHDETIKRELVEALAAEFERVDKRVESDAARGQP
jgi:uncharacterized protein (UPF0264 family)